MANPKQDSEALGLELWKAVHKGNINEVRRLLQLGADPLWQKIKGDKGMTPLNAADMMEIERAGRGKEMLEMLKAAIEK